MDPDPAIFVIDLQHASKKLIFNTIFSAYYFLKVHLHHFSKIKIQKESQNIRNQGFSYYFCMMIEGSGSWNPKNMWIRWIRIRLRIRNTAIFSSVCSGIPDLSTYFFQWSQKCPARDRVRIGSIINWPSGSLTIIEDC